jgi:hypothetical protein
MPCFFKHDSSAVRLVLEPLAAATEEDDVEVVFELLLELVPQAAIAKLARTTAASKNMSREARRCLLVMNFM